MKGAARVARELEGSSRGMDHDQAGRAPARSPRSASSPWCARSRPTRRCRVIDAIREGGVHGPRDHDDGAGRARASWSRSRSASATTSVVGAGTVLDPETARACILAGARFVVSPTLNLATIEMCRRYSVPVMPGALTPTEVLTAWTAGADVVKVFPCGAAGRRQLHQVAEGAAAPDRDDPDRRRVREDGGRLHQGGRPGPRGGRRSRGHPGHPRGQRASSSPRRRASTCGSSRRPAPRPERCSREPGPGRLFRVTGAGPSP